MQDSFLKYYSQIKNGSREEFDGCQNLLDEFFQ